MENSLDLRMGVGRKGWLVSWDSGTSGPAGYTTEHLQCVMVIINQGPQGEEVTWFVMHLSLQFSFILVSLGPDVYFPQGREEWWGPYKVNFICIWTEEKKVAIVSKGRGLWPKSKRASGVTGGSTVASMHPYVYPCPWVISSPWVWVGFTDLLLMNRIWQKWWDVTSKIKLQKDWLLSCVSCSLRKPATRLWAAPWRSQYGSWCSPRRAFRWDCSSSQDSFAALWEALSQSHQLICSQTLDTVTMR